MGFSFLRENPSTACGKALLIPRLPSLLIEFAGSGHHFPNTRHTATLFFTFTEGE
jgi:hypothetical protein